MDDFTLQTVLGATLDNLALADADELAGQDLPEELAELDGTRSFEQAGVLTYNAGLVLRMADGAEYQLTIVQSRQANE